jgi:hypothetical protein
LGLAVTVESGFRVLGLASGFRVLDLGVWVVLMSR